MGQLFSSNSSKSNNASYMFSGYRDYSDYVIIESFQSSFSSFRENLPKNVKENLYPNYFNVYEYQLHLQPKCRTKIKFSPDSSKNVLKNVYPKVSNIQQPHLQPQPEFQLKKTLVNQTDIKVPPNSSKNVSENVYPKVSNIQQPHLQPQPEFQLKKTLVNQTDIKVPPNSSKIVSEIVYPKVSNIQQPHLQPQPEFQLKKTLVNQTDIKVPPNSSKNVSENVYPKVSNIQQPHLQPQPEFQLKKALINQTDIKVPPNSSKNVSENVYPKVSNIQQPHLQPQPEFQLKKTFVNQTDIKVPPNSSKNVSENVYPKVSNIQQPYLQPQPEFQLKKMHSKSESEPRLKKKQVNQTEEKFQPNSSNNVTKNMHPNLYNMQQSFDNQQTVTKKQTEKEPEKISSDKLNASNVERYHMVNTIDEKKIMDTQLIQEIARSLRGILMTPRTFISIPYNVKIKIFSEFKFDTKEKLEIVVNLIFEKAVSEPVCSLMYANLCQSLIDCLKLPLSDSSKPDCTFKGILLIKCQNEFEVNISQKKLLTEDKSKKFDYQEIMNLRLRTIRFLGELFKFKIVSENIMHTCVIELLKCEKVETAEDQLECLCKLLASIGKDLDHPAAKFRVDQYFTQMSKITDYRYISTKIKFEIRNIIDLRDCNWVEKRDELNQKTFDQIKNEAKKEQEKEKAIPPYKMRPEEGKRKKQKKMTNFKDNVRNSSVQSGIGLSLSSNSLTNIQSKQKHFISETIDKDESNNISFGSNVGSSISSHSKESRRRGRSRSRSHFVDTSIECTRQNQTDYRDNLNEQIQSKNRIKKKDLTWAAYRIYRSKHPGPLTEKSFQRWVRYDGIDDPSFKWRGKKN